MRWRSYKKIPPNPPLLKGGTDLSPPFSKGEADRSALMQDGAVHLPTLIPEESYLGLLDPVAQGYTPLEPMSNDGWQARGE